jgi:hypothetical protein
MAMISPKRSYHLPSRAWSSFGHAGKSLGKVGIVEQMPANDSEKRRPLRHQPNDHNFGSLLMLAVTAGAFLLVSWVATNGLFLFLQEAPVR